MTKTKTYQYILLILMILVIIFSFVPQLKMEPSSFLEFPFIPALEEKARIIFFHVPTALITVIAYLIAMFYGIQYLRTNNIENDIKSVTSAALGLMFCILATVTGSVWAKFNWGSFWHWDPRETSIFILLLIYGAYFALRSALENPEKRAKLSSVYSIIAFLTTPFFVFIMPRMMIGLHPGALEIDAQTGQIVSSENTVIEFRMAPNMRVVFFASMIAFTMLYFWMWNITYRLFILKFKMNFSKE